ncbi:Protein kinase [Dispira simplex]|nr:Protein kinase [Dispira simplex]
MSTKQRIGNYTIIKTLGTGSFGKVRLGVHSQTGHNVALKFISRAQIDKAEMVGRVKREIQYLQLLRHPHIIKLYEVIMTSTDCIMVMEYAGGELFNYIVERGRMNENEARRFFQQIISAVDYCHRHKIVHRDLKPENLLLDKFDNVKIADFGLSNFMSDGEFLKTSCGSPNYAAPEVINGHFYSGAEVDVWSCGVILYVMLCGKLPFDDESIPQLFKKISSGVFAMPGYLSAEVQQLLTRMLVVKPLERITIAEIRDHPWFKRNLPEYLSPVAQEDIDTTTSIDDNVVNQLVRKLPYTVEAVVTALRNPQPDPTTHHIKVAYQLVADQNRIVQDLRHTNSNQLQNYTFGSSPPAWNAVPSSASNYPGGEDTGLPGIATLPGTLSAPSSRRGRSQTTSVGPRTPHSRVVVETPDYMDEDDPSSISVLSSSLPQQFVLPQQARAALSSALAQGSVKGVNPLERIRSQASTVAAESITESAPSAASSPMSAQGTSPAKPPPIAIPGRTNQVLPSTQEADEEAVEEGRTETFAFSPHPTVPRSLGKSPLPDAHDNALLEHAATPLIGRSKVHQFPTSYRAYQHPVAELGSSVGKPDQLPVSVPIPVVPSSRPNPRGDGSQPNSTPRTNRRPPRWHFGIRSRNPPREIMEEIYKTLRALGIQWKPFDAWHVRCRYIYPDTPPTDRPQPCLNPHSTGYVPDLVVKFDMQLYKIDSTSYLVDFKYVPPAHLSQAILGKDGSGPLPSGGSTQVAGIPPRKGTTTADHDSLHLLGQSLPMTLQDPALNVGTNEPVIHSIFPFFHVCVSLITKLAA